MFSQCEICYYFKFIMLIKLQYTVTAKCSFHVKFEHHIWNVQLIKNMYNQFKLKQD